MRFYVEKKCNLDPRQWVRVNSVTVARCIAYLNNGIGDSFSPSSLFCDSVIHVITFYSWQLRCIAT